MKGFYGTKRVEAEPSDSTVDGREGYTLRYPDGYQSWSPKPAFDLAYQPETAMSFSGALAALKAGQRVARAGWNGKGMWLVLVPGSTFPITADRPVGKALPHRVGEMMDYLPHIDMLTAQGALVPWLASQTDVLADDWTVVE